MIAPRTGENDAAFRIGDAVRVIERELHGIVSIRTAVCDAEIALQGAQVLSWRPKGQADLLWCAALPAAHTGKAIRGGIPVCWPWFGPHASNSKLPQHGLVRTIDWRLIATETRADDVHVIFETTAETSELRLAITVGARLSLELSTRNIGAYPLAITEALHTYFRVGDACLVGIHGLDGCRYRDNTDGGRDKIFTGVMSMTRETITLFDVAPDAAEIEDRVLGRRITILRRGGRSTIAWHPGANVAALNDVASGAEKNFVCVESGNIGSSGIVIAPGDVHRLTVQYEIVAL